MTNVESCELGEQYQLHQPANDGFAITSSDPYEQRGHPQA